MLIIRVISLTAGVVSLFTFSWMAIWVFHTGLESFIHPGMDHFEIEGWSLHSILFITFTFSLTTAVTLPGKIRDEIRAWKARRSDDRK